jgi:hypothetical protein
MGIKISDQKKTMILKIMLISFTICVIGSTTALGSPKGDIAISYSQLSPSGTYPGLLPGHTADMYAQLYNDGNGGGTLNTVLNNALGNIGSSKIDSSPSILKYTYILPWVDMSSGQSTSNPPTKTMPDLADNILNYTTNNGATIIPVTRSVLNNLASY